MRLRTTRLIGTIFAIAIFATVGTAITVAASTTADLAVLTVPSSHSSTDWTAGLSRLPFGRLHYSQWSLTTPFRRCLLSQLFRQSQAVLVHAIACVDVAVIETFIRRRDETRI